MLIVAENTGSVNISFYNCNKHFQLLKDQER